MKQSASQSLVQSDIEVNCTFLGRSFSSRLPSHRLPLLVARRVSGAVLPRGLQLACGVLGSARLGGL